MMWYGCCLRELSVDFSVPSPSQAFILNLSKEEECRKQNQHPGDAENCFPLPCFRHALPRLLHLDRGGRRQNRRRGFGFSRLIRRRGFGFPRAIRRRIPAPRISRLLRFLRRRRFRLPFVGDRKSLLHRSGVNHPILGSVQGDAVPCFPRFLYAIFIRVF